MIKKILILIFFLITTISFAGEGVVVVNSFKYTTLEGKSVLIISSSQSTHYFLELDGSMMVEYIVGRLTKEMVSITTTNYVKIAYDDNYWITKIWFVKFDKQADFNPLL